LSFRREEKRREEKRREEKRREEKKEYVLFYINVYNILEENN